MNFDTTASQENYFANHGEIAFEGVFTEEELAHLATLKKGYDLWRRDEATKKIVFHKTLGKLIFAMTQKRPVQILYDRIADKETIDLQHTCFQGVLIGVLISKTDNLITLFSREKKMTIDSPHLLIVYGEAGTRYIFSEKDPYATTLKKRGYAYGDRLQLEDFPYLYR